MVREVVRGDKHNLRKSVNRNAQISVIHSAHCTDLCFAICRFSQVVFVTSNNFTHNLLFYYPGQKKIVTAEKFMSLINSSIMWYRATSSFGSASTRPAALAPRARVADRSRCHMISHDSTADQSHEFLGCNDFFWPGWYFQLIPKTIGNTKRDCAWGCARGINTTWENLQI